MLQSAEARVMTCLAEECSYNCKDECCAPLIEVGADHPMCDTFTTGEVEMRDDVPVVADCKVMDCHFNHDEMCGAAGITLMTHSGHADCATFRP